LLKQHRIRSTDPDTVPRILQRSAVKVADGVAPVAGVRGFSYGFRIAPPGLRPIAVFDEMLRRHPELDRGIRRTPERRIRTWRALYGPECDMIFRQVREPDVLGLSDFADMSDLSVIVTG